MRIMKSNKIDELFRGKLAHFQKAPAPGSWEKISGALAGKRRILYWKWGSVAAAIAIVGLSVAFLVYKNHPDEPLSEAIPILDTLHDKGLPAPLAEGQQDAAMVAAEVGNESGADDYEEVEEVPADPDGRIEKQRRLVQADPIVEEEPDGNEINPVVEPEKRDTEAMENNALSTGEMTLMAETNLDSTSLGCSASAAEPEQVPIRIVYKKGGQTDLVAENDQNFVRKSFDKIGQITENLKLSEDAKARWKTTKEHILALNIQEFFKEKNVEETEDLKR